MTRTRRTALIAAGIALSAGASIGVGAAGADTVPVTSLQSGYVLCAGLDGAAGVCVEDPATTISELPRARQLVQDLTGG